MQPQLKFSELDLLRQMSDQAARSEPALTGRARAESMRRLLSYLNTLSDEEFEALHVTMESMIQHFQARRAAALGKAKPLGGEERDLATFLSPEATRQNQKAPTPTDVRPARGGVVKV